MTQNNHYMDIIIGTMF